MTDDGGSTPPKSQSGAHELTDLEDLERLRRLIVVASAALAGVSVVSGLYIGAQVVDGARRGEPVGVLSAYALIWAAVGLVAAFAGQTFTARRMAEIRRKHAELDALQENVTTLRRLDALRRVREQVADEPAARSALPDIDALVEESEQELAEEKPPEPAAPKRDALQTITAVAAVVFTLVVGVLTYLKRDPQDCLKYADWLTKANQELTADQARSLTSGTMAQFQPKAYEADCTVGTAENRTGAILSNLPPGTTTSAPPGTTTTTR